MLRLHIDEVGHHDMKTSDDPNQRYLGLTGVIMDVEYADGEFTAKLNELKQEIFGRSDFVLHRREILNRFPEPFSVLNDLEVHAKFDDALLSLVDLASYSAITAHIDKKEHRDRYVVWQFQPYHYCLTVMLERYVQALNRVNKTGDVLVESRGKKENKQLSDSYPDLSKWHGACVRRDFPNAADLERN
jgi:hypothetical protein